MSKDKQNIKCDVLKCKYNNNEKEHCELEEIKVSCDCDNDKCDCKEKTICNSYKERK